ETIKKHDAVLFITPEYNRSIPPVLKNALDIGSRPYGQNAWDKKPGAVISISAGGMGGFGANHQLRQVLACINVPVMAQPEAYIGNIDALFDEDGALNDERTATYLSAFMAAFLKWAQTNI
ncbi:MAG: NAD(P)H-dependent oxidoreductase, partial [Bacilli bacterium]